MVALSGWRLHRHHRGPQFLIDTTNTGWILLSGQKRIPRPGHQWVLFHGHGHAQRHTHRQGALDADRAARLEALPGWVWGASGEQRWERGFTALTQFVDEHGHTRVPHGHISADRFRLGQWVNTQRYTYRQGALDPRRTARLQALAGWVWNSDAPGRQVNAA